MWPGGRREEGGRERGRKGVSHEGRGGRKSSHTRGHNPRTTLRTFGARDLVQRGLAIPVRGAVVAIGLRGGQGGHDDGVEALEREGGWDDDDELPGKTSHAAVPRLQKLRALVLVLRACV